MNIDDQIIALENDSRAKALRIAELTEQIEAERKRAKQEHTPLYNAYTKAHGLNEYEWIEKRDKLRRLININRANAVLLRMRKLYADW